MSIGQLVLDDPTDITITTSLVKQQLEICSVWLKPDELFGSRCAFSGNMKSWRQDGKCKHGKHMRSTSIQGLQSYIDVQVMVNVISS